MGQMRRLTDQQVDAIARELAGRMSSGIQGDMPNSSGHGTDPIPLFRAPAGTAPDGTPAGGYVAATVGVKPMMASQPATGDGVFNTVDECVVAATIAFRHLSEATLAKR